jgi:hypothetical protein
MMFRKRWRRSLVVSCLATVALFQIDAIQAKPRSAPQSPNLRLVNVAITPAPYIVGSGSLQLMIQVELPASVKNDTILEVSSLISSPSKRSMRFLVYRQPIDLSRLSGSPETGRPRLDVTLVWDGTDQSKQLVQEGRYSYEIKAKLLAAGQNGPPRTQMVSWPRRGVLIVEGKPAEELKPDDVKPDGVKPQDLKPEDVKPEAPKR